MKVSVVVPHYDDLAGLDACLDALARQTLPGSDYEVVVADNGTPAGEAAVAGMIGGRARLVTVASRGAGPARNGGVAIAAGEVLAFTDADCRPDPRWLEEGLAALASEDVVGGAVEVLVRDPERLSGAEAFERVFAFDNERYVRRLGFTVTANMFCRRTVFETVGGFSDDVSEDLDWCRRAARMGFTLGFAPGALVGHPARSTWPDLRKKWRRLAAESYATWRAEGRSQAAYLLRTCALPLSAFVHLPKVLSSPALASPAQRAAAAAMLFRLRFWRFAEGLRLVLSGPAVRA